MTLQLEIVKMVPPGEGLGYVNNKAVFVPGTVVGDVVEVSILKEKKRHISAVLDTIISPGSKRVQAPCPHYQQCGGCSLMHLAYPDQLELKQKMLKEVFAAQQLEVSPLFVPSVKEFQFRFRTTLKLENGILGFSARSSHHVIAIPECRILSRGIMNHLPLFLKLGRNHCEFSLLESAHNGDTAISVSEGKRLVPLPGYPSSVVENYGYGPVALDSEGFAQSNPYITAALCQAILTEVGNSDRVCELYCGCGTFSLPLASQTRHLTGFDISKQAIETAKQNALKNGLNNVTFHAINVEKGIRFPATDVIVVDPPRKGLGNTILKQIGKSKTTKLIYISCNPSTLARDAKLLTSAYQFKLKSLSGYDMYCHSAHSEALAVFTR